MRKIQTLFIAIFCMSLMSVVNAKEPSPTSITGAKTIDSAQAKALFDKGVLFIDVRSDKDWAAGRIPDAIHIELKKVLSEATLGKQAKKADPVVFYCNGVGCYRSSKASKKAVGWGYTNVNYYRLGYPDWKSSGYPTE